MAFTFFFRDMHVLVPMLLRRSSAGAQSPAGRVPPLETIPGLLARVN